MSKFCLIWNNDYQRSPSFDSLKPTESRIVRKGTAYILINNKLPFVEVTGAARNCAIKVCNFN